MAVSLSSERTAVKSKRDELKNERKISLIEGQNDEFV